MVQADSLQAPILSSSSTVGMEQYLRKRGEPVSKKTMLGQREMALRGKCV